MRPTANPMKPGTVAAIAEPFANFTVVLAATENDAADLIAPARAGRRHDLARNPRAIEPFNLPQIRLDAGDLGVR